MSRGLYVGSQPSDPAYRRILAALHEHGSSIEEQRDGDALAQCPAHNDGRPSLHVTDGDDRALVYCFAGCETDAILGAIGMSRDDLFNESITNYAYRDRTGATVRTVTRHPGKQIRQSGQTKGEAPLYRLPEIIAAVEAGRTIYLCYSDDTEVLTPTGWVRFPDLSDEVTVAQFDRDTGAISFVTPTARQVFDYDGEMVHIHGRCHDALITPDHRMLTRWDRGSMGPTRAVVVPADDIGGGRSFPVAGTLSGDAQVAEDDARMLAAWQADGCWERRGNKAYWNMRKERKNLRLHQMLDRLRIPWEGRNQASSPEWTRTWVQRDSHPFIAANPKVLSWSMLDWPLSAKRAFLEELGHWDGDFVGQRGIRYFTSVKQNAEVVTALAATAGYGSVMRVDSRPERPEGSDAYVVSLIRADWRSIATNRPPGRVPYSGKVYCLSVPSTFLVTRRNGKNLIAGNCEGEPDVHAWVRQGVDATTAPAGARNFDKADVSPLAGANVIAVVDRDEAGDAWAHLVQDRLRGLVASLAFKRAKVGKDSSDHIAAGYGQEDLEPYLLPNPLLDAIRTGAWLDAQNFPPMQWVVPGLIPDGFGLLTGPPKLGKSWMVLGLSLSAASGRAAFGRIPLTGARPVLYLALEDSDRRMQSRVRVLMRDEATPEAFHYAIEAPPGATFPLVQSWLDQHEGQNPMVVIDTLGRIMPNAKIGESQYQRDYRIGSAVKSLAQPGVSIIVVHHVRKTETQDWMDSTSGTNGLNGAADFTLNMARERNSPNGLLRVTGRDVDEGEYGIIFDRGMWVLDGRDLAQAASNAEVMQRQRKAKRHAVQEEEPAHFPEPESDGVLVCMRHGASYAPDVGCPSCRMGR